MEITQRKFEQKYANCPAKWRMSNFKAGRYPGSGLSNEAREHSDDCERQDPVCAKGVNPRRTLQKPICNKILTEHKINNRKLHHFIIDAGLKFHARTVEEMQVEGAELQGLI